MDGKSEIRISKFETNSNVQNPKLSILKIRISEIRACFGFRHGTGGRTDRISRFEFVASHCNSPFGPQLQLRVND